MTLLRRFTGWAIGLSKILDRKGLFSQGVRSLQRSQRDHPASQFQTLYWHLLLSYLAAMAAIVGVSTLAIYQVVAYTLYQQLDRQLDSLAQAAAHSLPALEAQQGKPPNRLPPVTDNDGDIDLPWQDLRITTQSIEWFDQTLNRLAQTGNQFPATSLRTIGFANVEDLRTLTIPVYLVRDNGQGRQFRGYVRVSQLTEDLQEELDRLSIALAVGGVIAGVLIGGTGWWLTRRSVRPIEQSVLQLQQFTADASHELRSPLTAIKTAVEVMQSHPERIHPSDVKKLDAIDSATQQMTHLVEDLLLLARMEVTTELRVKLQPIPLDDMLEDLLTLLELQADEKGVRLTIELPPSTIWIKGNPAQLRRMFANLLENAVQYTPAGGTVRLTAKTLTGMVVIKIEDTGIGIAPEQIPHVFDRFWRADQARSRRAKGSGLGLAIAQAIAQAHSGEITVTSQLGVGSCFQVRLPTG